METEGEILARVRRRINAAKSRRGLTWRQIFKECDKDESGFLDFKELHSAIRDSLGISGQTVCDYEVKYLFRCMDKDASGGVDLEELLVFLSQGPRRPEDEAARAHLRVERTRKNLRTSLLSLGTSEGSVRNLFKSIDVDGDLRLSPFEFKSFVRGDLKLSIWDMANRDLDEFYTFLNAGGLGITPEILLSFIRGKKEEAKKVQDFSFYEISRATKVRKKKTYKQHLMETCHGSNSMPSLSKWKPTPSVTSLGRSHAPANRICLTRSAKEFFTPHKLGCGTK